MANDATPVVRIGAWMHDGLDVFLFADGRRARLEALGDVVTWSVGRALDDPDERDRLRDVTVLVTGWGCPHLGRRRLDALPSLRLVAHAAGTVKDLSTNELWQRDIVVTSAAPANALPVAEYTLAMILLSGKDVLRRRDSYRDEGLTLTKLLLGTIEPVGNRGRRVGLIGASLIGRRVVELLRPFDFEVAITDPFLSDDEAAALGVRRLPLDALLRWCDVVSIHAPDLPSTQGMIGATELRFLRDGATLINTARGGLVDHEALERELVSGRLSAVLDVTDPEPYPEDSPLWPLPNVVITPHLAGAQGNELARLADLALDEVERFGRGEPPRYPVVQSDLDRIA